MCPPPPPAARVASRRYLKSFHTRRRKSCVTEFTAVVILFLGRPKLLVEMVHKLLLLWNPQEKVAGCEIRKSRGPELKRQVFFSWRDLSIVEVQIHSENVEHPGVNGVELRPFGKWSLLNLHSFEEEARRRNWVHLFESRCICSNGVLRVVLSTSIIRMAKSRQIQGRDI